MFGVGLQSFRSACPVHNDLRKIRQRCCNSQDKARLRNSLKISITACFGHWMSFAVWTPTSLLILIVLRDPEIGSGLRDKTGVTSHGCSCQLPPSLFPPPKKTPKERPHPVLSRCIDADFFAGHFSARKQRYLGRPKSRTSRACIGASNSPVDSSDIASRL
jgi:hypothetical protein